MRHKGNTEAPVNLKGRFGRRYRVTYEPSYYATCGLRAKREEPWLMILICRYGHVLPWTDRLLAASVDGHPIVAGNLRRLRCCTVVQDGDSGELTATFDPADFQKIARVMRPRRRRELTATERATLVDRLRPGRQSGPDEPTEAERTRRTGVFGTPVGLSTVDGEVPNLV